MHRQFCCHGQINLYSIRIQYLNYTSYFNDLVTAIKLNTITTTTPPHTNSKLKTLSSLQMNDNTIPKEKNILYCI